MSAPEVEVSCAARLHLGFLDLTAEPGRRRFGSVGLALDAPRTRLTLRRAGSDTDLVQGVEQARAARLLARIKAHLRLHGGYALMVHEAIPPHAGLGSGTQLALAVATAMRALHGLPADLPGDARCLGRGGRSGIGVATFAHGGLVVDGGTGPAQAVPPALVRMAVPEDWRVLLVMDAATSGLSGDGELAGFAALPPMSAEASGALCRRLLMQALPAVAEDDLAGFGDAVGAIQRSLGQHFAPAQGGLFTSDRVAAAIETLRQAGAVGLGQSSWGPTAFAFVRGDEAARSAGMRAQAAHPGLDIRIARALNRGATVAVAG